MKKLRLIYLLLLLGLTTGALKAQTAFATEEDLKKQAAKLFDNEAFEEAYPLYTQLTSIYPKDPDYNYRIGVCMLYSLDDKEQPISYLEFASRNKNVDKEVFFYLARAYHLNYRFDDAIKTYQSYKKVASGAKAEKLQVDHQIEMCKNGKKLLHNITDLVVIDKKEMSRDDFFRAYDVSGIGGKLLVKPDEDQFKSALDKKKKESSIIYLASNNNQIYYSSYGENAERGKDIFIIRKLPSGEWSKPQTLGYPVNTEYDEDFPFLHPNGKVLYFCSKGHNSMGGYDIFKSTLNEATDTWNKPVNMDFPINTPDDDILYVTNEDEKEAYFASARSSTTGKTAVYHIKSDRRAIDKAVIKGILVKNRDNQSSDFKITVKDMRDNSIIGIYNSKTDGSYFIPLPNGGKFLYTVEAPDFETQSEVMELPVQSSFKPLKQEISYEAGTDKLVVKNLFDTGDADDKGYLDVLGMIREKSKMEVNVNDIADSPLADNSDNTTSPPATKESPVTDTKKSAALSNNDIVKIALEDAKDAETEAKEARVQADVALGLANQKNELAQNKAEEGRKLTAEAALITDPAQKRAAIDQANATSKEAALLNDATVVAFNLAKKLEKSAATKQEEAELSLKYAKDLEAAVKAKNSADALTKLDDQKQKLETLSQEKTSADDLVSSLKIDLDSKERELNNAIQTSVDIQQEMADNELLIGNVQADADKTKNEQLKKGLLDQVAELKEENIDKQKELAQNEEKILKLQKEFNGIKNETELVNTVIDKSKTETSETAAASIATIDKNKLEQQVNSIQTDPPPVMIASDTPPVVTTSPETTTVPAPVEVDTEVFVKVNEKYTDEVAAAEKIENAAEREKTKAEVLQKWAAAIDTVIARQEENFINVTDPEIKARLASSISDAQQLSKDKQTAANESLAKAETFKQQETILATNTPVNENKEPDTDSSPDPGLTTLPDRVAEPPASTVTTDKPVVADVMAVAKINDKYTNDLAGAEQMENIVERESAKADVLKKWSEEIDIQVAKQKQDFLAADDPETKALLANSISDAQKLSEEKQTQANESLARVEMYKQGNTVAVVPPVTTEVIAPEDTSGTPEASDSEREFVYTSPASKEQVSRANVLTGQASGLETQSNELRMKAETLADINDKNTIYAQAEELKKQAENKKIEAAGIIAAVNKTEYTASQVQLEQLAKSAADNPADDLSMAEMLKDEALLYFDKAQKQRSEAAQSDTYYSKKTALEDAYANEMLALEKQKKANDIYKKYSSGFAVTTPPAATSPPGMVISNNQDNPANTNPSNPVIVNNQDTPVNNNPPATIIANNQNDPVNTPGTAKDPDDTLYIYSNPPLIRDSTTDNQAPSTTIAVPPATTGQALTPVLTGNEAFERKTVPVYSAARPIPVNEKLPEGLIFKVQIGAFRNPIPQDLFEGMTPITGETTPQGFTRYTAGIFVKFATADKVKREIRDLGYKDAFVVAFLNGKRIPIAEALTMAGIDPATIVQIPSPGLTAPVNAPNSVQNNVPGTTAIAPAQNVSAVGGLFYTVQVGVYSQPVTAAKLYNIQPLFAETTSNGMMRYNTGIYNNMPRAVEAKNRAMEIGIKDAFVTAYYNGKRISMSEAALLANQDAGVFSTATGMNVLPASGRNGQPPAITGTTTNNQPATSNQQPATNNQRPTASPLQNTLDQNNALPVDAGVVFKVQIGAFKDEVPITIANKFLQIAGKGIRSYKDENGLTIYTVGTFKSYEDADKVREEVRTAGVADAFIVAYNDGKKIAVEEAQQLINK